MFQKILLPIDLDQLRSAEAALRVVNCLISNDNPEVVLLYVMPEIPAIVAHQIPAGTFGHAESDAQVQLKKLAEEHELPERATIIVRTGNAYREILTTARDVAADIIVMASHEPELSDYLLGSVAARTVRHAHCSVMVVRGQTEQSE